MIIQNQLSRSKIQRIRNSSFKCNANIYSTYAITMKYRNEHCIPKRIEDCVVVEENFIYPMQDLNNHQLKKIFLLKQNLKFEMMPIKDEHPDAKFFEKIKCGNDTHISQF